MAGEIIMAYIRSETLKHPPSWKGVTISKISRKTGYSTSTISTVCRSLLGFALKRTHEPPRKYKLIKEVIIEPQVAEPEINIYDIHSDNGVGLVNYLDNGFEKLQDKWGWMESQIDDTTLTWYLIFCITKYDKSIMSSVVTIDNIIYKLILYYYGIIDIYGIADSLFELYATTNSFTVIKKHVRGEHIDNFIQLIGFQSLYGSCQFCTDNAIVMDQHMNGLCETHYQVPHPSYSNAECIVCKMPAIHVYLMKPYCTAHLEANTHKMPTYVKLDTRTRILSDKILSMIFEF